MIDVSRDYGSEYTLDIEDDIVVRTDIFRFTETGEGLIRGAGQLDSDGDTMILTLAQKGNRLEGAWEEHHESGHISGAGIVYFEIDPGDGTLIGQWDVDAGSWSLVPIFE